MVRCRTLKQLTLVAKAHEIEPTEFEGGQYYAIYELPDGTMELRAPSVEDMKRHKAEGSAQFKEDIAKLPEDVRKRLLQAAKGAS
jgi:hypothetical protein